MSAQWDHKVRICRDNRRIRYCAKAARAATCVSDPNHSFLEAVHAKTYDGRHISHDEVYGVERLYRSYVLNQTVGGVL